MRLVIFDVDGTLTRPESVDAAFFIEAFAETFGITQVTTDRTAYSSATEVQGASNALASLRADPSWAVARGGRGALLRDEGAEQIITDFLPVERFMDLLREARPPRP